MPYQVKVLKKGVSLPDGTVRFVLNEVVTLSDDQYAQINPAAYSSGALQDLGGSPSGGQAPDSDLTAIAAIDSSVAGMLATDGSGWIRKTYAQVRIALGLATVATSGKLADATDVTVTGAAVGDLLSVTAVSGGSATAFARTSRPALLAQAALLASYLGV